LKTYRKGSQEFSTQKIQNGQRKTMDRLAEIKIVCCVENKVYFERLRSVDCHKEKI